MASVDGLMAELTAAIEGSGQSNWHITPAARSVHACRPLKGGRTAYVNGYVSGHLPWEAVISCPGGAENDYSVHSSAEEAVACIARHA